MNAFDRLLMGLPCYFTKQFREGDAVMVCSHVYEENLAQGFPLSWRRAQMERHAPPLQFTYENAGVSRGDVTVQCLECAGKPPRTVDYVELWWKGGRLEMSAPASGARA
jgi:hypothetical protein